MRTMSTEFPPLFHDLLEAQLATPATIGKDGGPQPANVFAVDMNA